MIINWRSILHDFDIYHLSACFYFEKKDGYVSFGDENEGFLRWGSGVL